MKFSKQLKIWSAYCRELKTKSKKAFKSKKCICLGVCHLRELQTQSKNKTNMLTTSNEIKLKPHKKEKQTKYCEIFFRYFYFNLYYEKNQKKKTKQTETTMIYGLYFYLAF